MPEAGLEGHPSSPDDELCNDVDPSSSNVREPCIGLLHALSELATRKRALDVEQFEIATTAYLDDALDAFWVTRRSCDLLAIVVQKTQSTTGDEEAIKCKALVAYSILANPDDITCTSLSELSIVMIRALYPGIRPWCPETLPQFVAVVD